jgi:hypothetical protein
MHASTPLILRKSRMRRRARTDLCGGRSANGRPYRDTNPELPEKSFSASSMVQAFPGPQDVVGVRRWRVRCGLPTTRTQPPDPPKWQCTGSRATEKARSVRTDTLRLSGAETIAAEIRGENGATPSIRVRRACCTTHSGSCTCQAHPVGRVGLDNANPHCRN